MTAESSPPPKESGGVSKFLSGFSQLLKALVLIILVSWAFYDKEFVEDWLSSLSGGELFGFKFEREAIDQATSELQKLANLNNTPEGSLDERLARKALVRAARVAPTIVESRILWADDGWSTDKPGNQFNQLIVEFLEKLKITVVPASSTAEAMNAMRISPFDIVISNAWRPKDPENLKRPLSVCKVHYFDFADDQTAMKFIYQTEVDSYGPERARAMALDRFNQEANTHAAAGFDLAETIFSLPGTDKTKPSVILFAAATARVARSLCDYTITNRGDVLLNSVVSILEQRHADRLIKRQAKSNQPFWQPNADPAKSDTM